MKNRYVLTSLFVAMGLLVFFSCAKETGEMNAPEAPAPLTAELQAYQDFAVILSKAVYNEPELRAFLKNEALKQYDKDYDVFYPWTKDLLVDGERSFESVLKAYDEDSKLEEIEKEIPLLTILVPDWSWVNENAFSVINWDTSSDAVVVGYKNRESTNSIFSNGELTDNIPSYIIPEFPVLLIKSNERMKTGSESTKGGPINFSFVDDEFNGALAESTKGDHIYEHNFNTPNPATNYIMKTEIPQKVLDAYTLGNSEPMLKHRDYIYYGMTPVIDTGYVDFHYAERILKCKINPQELNSFTDDLTSSGVTDWQLSVTFNGQTSGQPYAYTDAELYALDWVDGCIELVFDIHAGNIHEQHYRSVSFKDAFYVSRVYEYYHYVWLNKLKYRTYYIEVEDLVPRWIDLNFTLFTWDLSYYANSYSVTIKEKDSGATLTGTFSGTFNMTANVSGSKKINWGVNMGASFSASNSYSYTQDSDELGTFNVYYTDPIVTSIPNPVAQVYQYSTGNVDVLVVPIKKY